MMKNRCTLILFATALLIAQFSLISHAQESPPSESTPQAEEDQALQPADIRIIHVSPEPQPNTLELNVFFDVLDEQGNPLPKDAVEIESAEIQLRDPPDPVEASIEDPRTPIHIALLLDASGSMGSAKMSAARDAAKASLEYAPPGKYTFFGVFSFTELGPTEEFIPLQPFTNDQNLVQRAIDMAESTDAGTCLFNATARAIDVLDERIEDPQDRRAIILFTDGRDELQDGTACSKNRTEDDVIAKATSDSHPRTPIYTIGLCDDPACDNTNLEVLRKLAEETSASFEYGQLGEVNEAFAHIMTDLNSQWVAQTNVVACGEEEQPYGTLRVNFRGREDPLSEEFRVPFDGCINPRPEAAIEFIGPAEEASHNYSGDLVINSTNRHNIDTIRVQIFNEDNVRVRSDEYIYSDYGHDERVPINIDMSDQPPGAHIIRFYADTESGEAVRTPEGGSVLGESEFVHVLPADLQPFKIDIGAKNEPDYETMTFDVEIIIEDPENRLESYNEFLKYTWRLEREGGTVVKRGDGDLNAEQVISVEVPEMMLDATRPQPFTLFVTVQASPELEAEAQDTFNLQPREQEPWLQRFLSWIADYLLYIGIAIGVVILLVLMWYLQRRKKVQQQDYISLPPSPPTSYGSSSNKPEERAPDVASNPQGSEGEVPKPINLETTINKLDKQLVKPFTAVKLIVHCNDELQEEVIHSFPCVIGRDDPSGKFEDVTFHIRIDKDRGVSRRHMQITQKNNQLFVTDLDSNYGTYIYSENATPGEYVPQSDEQDTQVPYEPPGAISERQKTDENLTTITNPAWKRLEADKSVPLNGSTTIRLGPVVEMRVEPQSIPYHEQN